jgi:microsomal dipeptidase-like Zn-dependent dipeptidase
MVVQTTYHHAPHRRIVLVTKGTHHAHARNRSRLTSRFEEVDAGVAAVTTGDGDVDHLGALRQVDGVRADDLHLQWHVDQIGHVCQIAGNSRHAAIGIDLDGGYGTELTPKDLDTFADVQRIPDLLRRRGYRAKDIVAVMHGNWVWVL